MVDAVWRMEFNGLVGNVSAPTRLLWWSTAPRAVCLHSATNVPFIITLIISYTNNEHEANNIQIVAHLPSTRVDYQYMRDENIMGRRNSTFSNFR